MSLIRSGDGVARLSSYDVETMAGSAADHVAHVFFNPGPDLLRVWQFAGPACCVKVSGVARSAGVAAVWRDSPLGTLSAVQLWEEWWPRLAEESLSGQLGRQAEGPLILDRAWATLRRWPVLANRPTPKGRPIVVSVQHAQRDLAELLRRSGALLGKRAADLLLHEAACRGDAAVVALLLLDASGSVRAEPWAAVNAEPKRQAGTVLDAALTHGRSECAELIKSAGGRHSLHWAARLAIVADVEAWLEDGACADERDGSGATPLWLVVKGTTSKSAVSTGNHARDRCMDLLLGARATVDVLPIGMETPLLLAAVTGDAPCCARLLAARANPSVRDREGRTPLDCAANAQIHGLLHNASCISAWDTSLSARKHHRADWRGQLATSSRIPPADFMAMQVPQPCWLSGDEGWYQ